MIKIPVSPIYVECNSVSLCITKNAGKCFSQEKQGRQIGLQVDGYFSHGKGRIQLDAHS